MSTYNGERYLSQQLESIRNQVDVEVLLTIRDDGSSDSTETIVKSYQDTLSICFYKGQNCGPARSFLDLVKQSLDDCDFYAFCDQDDVWDSDKLSVAINAIKSNPDEPALYLGNTCLVDENLKKLPFDCQDHFLTFGESLVFEFAAGCTMVMNKKMRDIVNEYYPSYLSMHDVWVYSLAKAIGATVVFDIEPHMKYRQHSSNTIGQGQGEIHEWKRRLHRFVNSEHSRSRRAIELFNGYRQYVKGENLEMLEKFVSARHSLYGRLSLIADSRFKCGPKKTWRLFRISVLLNQY